MVDNINKLSTHSNRKRCKVRELSLPQTIFIRRNEGEEYEDYIFRAISDVPDGQNQLNIGGRNFLASWLIEKREKRDDGVPNAAAMGLQFNNKENSIVMHVLDGKLAVINLSLGSGENFDDGIIEEEKSDSRRNI